MPGSVANAAPTTVMPQFLARQFERSQEYTVVDNQYRNGESQRSKLTETSRKRWRAGGRWAPTLLTAMRAFHDARNGPHEAFYFYDPWDTSPKFSHDPTGVSTAGRFTVRFDGPWEQSVSLARGDAQLVLVETG